MGKRELSWIQDPKIRSLAAFRWGIISFSLFSIEMRRLVLRFCQGRLLSVAPRHCPISGPTPRFQGLCFDRYTCLNSDPCTCKTSKSMRFITPELGWVESLRSMAWWSSCKVHEWRRTAISNRRSNFQTGTLINSPRSSSSRTRFPHTRPLGPVCVEKGQRPAHGVRDARERARPGRRVSSRRRSRTRQGLHGHRACCFRPSPTIRNRKAPAIH